MFRAVAVAYLRKPRLCRHGLAVGACDETADGMSEAKIEAIIAAMRGERYRFAPVRRVLIPKKNGKSRPLGLPTEAA